MDEMIILLKLETEEFFSQKARKNTNDK